MSRSIDEGIVVLMCVQPLLDSCPAFATRAGHVPVELFFRVVRLNAILAWQNDDGDLNNSHIAGVLLDTGCVYLANKTEFPQKKPSLQSLALRIQRTHGIDPTALWLAEEARAVQRHAPVADVRSVTTLRADDTASMTVKGVSSTLLNSTEEFTVQTNPDATIKRVLSSVTQCVERHVRVMGNVQITTLTRYSRLQQTSAVMKWLKAQYWPLASKFDVTAVEDTISGVAVRDFDPAPHVCPVHRVLARRQAAIDTEVTFCCMRGEVCAIHAAIGMHNEAVQKQTRHVDNTPIEGPVPSHERCDTALATMGMPHSFTGGRGPLPPPIEDRDDDDDLLHLGGDPLWSISPPSGAQLGLKAPASTFPCEDAPLTTPLGSRVPTTEPPLRYEDLFVIDKGMMAMEAKPHKAEQPPCLFVALPTVSTEVCNGSNPHDTSLPLATAWQKVRPTPVQRPAPPLTVPSHEIPSGCRVINGDVVLVDSDDDDDDDFPHCF